MRNVLAILLAIAATNSFAIGYCDITSVTKISTSDCLALRTLYYGTGGTKWKNHTNWFAQKPASQWYGVKVEKNRVIELIIPDNNLIGSLNKNFGDLTALQVLDISQNKLSGTIPDTIGNFTKLKYFIISYNKFTGKIPASLGKMTSVFGMDISNNFLIDTISPSYLANSLYTGSLFLERNCLADLSNATIKKIKELKLFQYAFFPQKSKNECKDYVGNGPGPGGSSGSNLGGSSSARDLLPGEIQEKSVENLRKQFVETIRYAR